MQKANSKDYIDLMDLFFVILKHWKSIMLSTILMGVIAYVYSKYLMVPQYTSTSELYVLSKSTSITSLADVQLGTNLTNDYLVVVNGRPVLDKVIDNLGLDETYKSLLNKITLENLTDTRILEINVQDSNPQRAKLIADELAEVASAFISEKMDQDPPSIIQYGYADGGQTSPNVKKNTIMGALVGAFLTIAILTVIYLMDDRIMEQEDIEKQGLNVLGTVPYEDDSDDLDAKVDKKRKRRK